MKYEDFNYDIGNESNGRFTISEVEYDNHITSINEKLYNDITTIFNKVKSEHKEFFSTSPNAIKLSNKDDWYDGEGISIFDFDMNEIVTPNGKNRARGMDDDPSESKYAKEYDSIMKDLLNASKGLPNKYFSEWIRKGADINVEYGGDWDEGPILIYIKNIYFVSGSTEAIKDIVKKVAKKAADKAGIMPAGAININKGNIKGFAKAASILLNYGQSRELINRSFKGIDIKSFGSKHNLDLFMNSVKPVGKFHVAQGWLIFELMETDTYKLKNGLSKEEWDSMYDAAQIVTKRANYITIKIIKELFGSREIELHPNPIGHLLSKNGTKARVMFKLGKVKIEDGTYETATDLVDRIRSVIGIESFDVYADVIDMAELEYGIEEITNELMFFDYIGVESDMIDIYHAFGDIEDLNEMIAIESSNFNYFQNEWLDIAALENSIELDIKRLEELELSLESMDEGTEGFKEVTKAIVDLGKELIKKLLTWLGLGLSTTELANRTGNMIKKTTSKYIRIMYKMKPEAKEKFVLKTKHRPMLKIWFNKFIYNKNKNSAAKGLAEVVHRSFTSENTNPNAKGGRKFLDNSDVKKIDGFLNYWKFMTAPDSMTSTMTIADELNYKETINLLTGTFGPHGAYAVPKCYQDVEEALKGIKKHLENPPDYFTKEMIDALKRWNIEIKSIVKSSRDEIVAIYRSCKALGNELKNGIEKAEREAGVASTESVIYGIENTIAKSNQSQAIINEILNRMDQDPILKLAKDKELIEIKPNSKSKGKIFINFKEIKEIEEVLTPEDIQKYGGSTYQFLLKLSDTFNKNIMWNMKEITEAARSLPDDVETMESLTGRAYYIKAGIESLDDFIDEILMESGVEDFSEFKESAKAWFKRIIAKIIDFIGKDRIVYSFQVRNYKDIKKKVMRINEHNMNNYDIYTITKLVSIFADLNKRKYFFYKGLKSLNPSNSREIKSLMNRLDVNRRDVLKLADALTEMNNKMGDYVSKKTPTKGMLRTLQSTISKIKFEYIDVRQTFLEVEKIIDNGNMSEVDENAMRGFLTISKVLQSEYLRGSTNAFKMIRKLLYDPKPHRKGNESIDENGLLTISTEDIDFIISWNWYDIESKGVISTESKYDPHPLYIGIIDEAEKDISKIAKKVAEDILKTSEYKEFKEEVERKSKEDDFLRRHISEVLKINGNYVESTYNSIELISFDEEVYYMDSWDKLESAIVKELNKYAGEVHCRPGYKWVFDKPADDQPQFTAYIKKVSSGTEGLGDAIKDIAGDLAVSTVAIAGAIGIVVGAEKLWEKTPWGKKQVEARIKKEIEKQELEKEALDQKRIARLNEEARKQAKAVYKEIVDDATDKVKIISKEIIKNIPKMPEFAAFKKEIDEKSKSDEFVKEFKDDIMYISADDVSNYDFGISALDFSQNVYLIDAWTGLSKAIINEMNKHAHEIPCKPGYKWVFNDAFDDESCFWCILQYTGNGGTESIESEYIQYDIISFEDVEDFYKDRAHYKGSFSDAVKIIKNGIVAFIKPFTPSGRREALRRKQEEQERLEKEREEAARKNELAEKTRIEMTELYAKYVNKALPVAKKEAEKIIKMLPNFPKFKALVKEVSDYGKEHDWDNAIDCIFYYVDGKDYDADDMVAIISYDQDLIGFDNHYDLEAIIIKRLEQIADKIPHPDGWYWTFSEPFDDEACIWMYLEKLENKEGNESIESGLEYSQDEFKSINSAFKSLKTSALPIVDKISNEVLNDVINSKEYKKLIEINKGFKFEIGDIYDKGDIGSADRFEVFEMTDTISGIEMSSDVEAFVKLVKSKFRDKISSIPIKDGFKWDIVIHYDEVSAFYCQLYPSNFEGTEGILDTIKQKWNNKVNEIKRDIENQKRLNKTLTLTEDQAKKLRDNAYKVAKEMFKDLKNETRKSGLKIELTQSSEFHNVIIVEYEDDDEYKWSINLATYYDEDTYDDAVHKYEEFPKIIDAVIDRHKSKLGYEIDGWETNNGEEIIIPMPKAINISTKGIESFDIGEEGILDTIKQKWKDGIEKQKARREKERKELEKKADDLAKSKYLENGGKLYTKEDIKKLQKLSLDTANKIKKEIQSFVKSNMSYVNFDPCKDDETINDTSYRKEVSWELWIGRVDDDDFKSFDKGEDYDRFIKAVDGIVNKYKDKLGFELDYWDIDGGTMFIFMKDSYYVDETSTESEIVQAIYDEFGLEGLTNIIQKIIKK